MLALENPRLAGYMLTGNRSMFLETDGSLAWLYHCPMVHSLLHTMCQCYDRIPILYEGEIRFVDPITKLRDKLILMPLHRIVLIESRTFFNSIWTKKTLGIHLRLE